MRNIIHHFNFMAGLVVAGASLFGSPVLARADDTAKSLPNRPAMTSDTEKSPSHRAARLRVESVGYRIALANADRCDVPDMMTGLILHDLASYDPAVRPAVGERFHLGQGFGVMDVVPDSAAARAGLRAGDEIIAAEDTDLTAFQIDLIGRSATSQRVENMASWLQEQLRHTSVALTIRRDGHPLALALGADAGCGGRMAYMPEGPVNAWSDGRYVAITKAMIDFSKNDDELAFVVAHEMAHNLLHHANTLTGTSPVLAMFGIGSHLVKNTEVAADRFAVDLLLRTSFDPIRAEAMFHRTKLADLLDLGMTHPMGGRRIQIIESELAFLHASVSSPPQPDLILEKL